MGEKKGKGIKVRLPMDKWMLTTLILAILLPVSVVLNRCKPTGMTALSGNEVADKVLEYINRNLVREGTKAMLVSVEKDSGLYRIETSYEGQEIPVYATMDGKYLILPQGVIDMSKEVRQREEEKQSQASTAFSGLTEKSKECINKLELDESVIDNCIKQEGITLIQKEYDLTQKYKARGSPTIFFNGKNLDPVMIFGDRSTESFKKVLCCSFKELPEECSNFASNCSIIDVPKSDKPEIKVFVMAYCPFGVGVLKSLLPLYKEFKGKVDFDVHYVIYGSRDNPESMHGANELNQDVTQLCIRKHYGEDAFWDYVACHYGVSGTTQSGGC